MQIFYYDYRLKIRYFTLQIQHLYLTVNVKFSNHNGSRSWPEQCELRHLVTSPYTLTKCMGDTRNTHSQRVLEAFSGHDHNSPLSSLFTTCFAARTVFLFDSAQSFSALRISRLSVLAQIYYCPKVKFFERQYIK